MPVNRRWGAKWVGNIHNNLNTLQSHTTNESFVYGSSLKSHYMCRVDRAHMTLL